MKKLFAFVLAVLFVFGAMFAMAEPMLGGWTVSEDNEITDEMKDVFDKVMEGLVGVDYEPIALLGTQLVSGTNFCFLCRGTVVYPGAAPQLMLVFIYRDLEGNASVTSIQELDIAQFTADAME